MTVDEYKRWKNNRGPEGTWKHADCAAADALVKKESMQLLKQKLRTVAQPVRAYVLLVARANFGSAETDKFMETMKAYPDWI